MFNYQGKMIRKKMVCALLNLHGFALKLHSRWAKEALTQGEKTALNVVGTVLL
jgi:hypothetical protein